MRSARGYFRAFNCRTERTICTSSDTFLRTPNLGKTFFKSVNSEDNVVKRLCRENRHEEAINNLCERHRLTEAIQVLDHIERPSPSVYSNLLQLCLQQKALESTKKIHAHIKRSGFLPGVHPVRGNARQGLVFLEYHGIRIRKSWTAQRCSEPVRCNA
ncbi:hypothetical protein L2E82_33604 [Cichorium intybus]|uniref:Uncharacterized protein n=1 Tax=Cichorium intybus TaxID=13427 RepID=A0ACB9BKR1_CICIN|nr:hypothetical protein L2E82_33604 [Cichorium intybus]